MQRDTLVRVLRARGFRAVETAGGLVPLQQWRPYDGARSYRGELVEVVPGQVEVRDVVPPGMIAGTWPVRR